MRTLQGTLTDRQLEVVDWLARGYDNRQIACRMGIGTSTLAHHIGEILMRMGLCNRYELILVALNEGRVDLPERVAEIVQEHKGCAESAAYEW